MSKARRIPKFDVVVIAVALLAGCFIGAGVGSTMSEQSFRTAFARGMYFDPVYEHAVNRIIDSLYEAARELEADADHIGAINLESAARDLEDASFRAASLEMALRGLKVSHMAAVSLEDAYKRSAASGDVSATEIRLGKEASRVTTYLEAEFRELETAYLEAKPRVTEAARTDVGPEFAHVIRGAIVGGTVSSALFWFLLLPGAIARKRGHGHKDAIRLCGLVGLLFPPAWVVALIWAHSVSSAPKPLSLSEQAREMAAAREREQYAEPRKFKITGIDHDTGMDTALVLEAADEHAAKTKAIENGILVSGIRAV